MNELLSVSQVNQFRQEGLLILRGFYDLQTEIRPIQRAIHSIIGLVIARHRLAIVQQPFAPANFDSGYQELIAVNRRYGGEVYDAVKQIPAFMRLMTKQHHEKLFQELRGTDLPGIAALGYGIRIDNPGEGRFMAKWHQEYLGQLRSLDGISFWIPLHSIDESLGAVEYCVGSHKEGLFKVRARDPDSSDAGGAYALRLDREADLLARYPHIQPSTEEGDLVIIDFLTMHCSGFNRSNRARWSMQTRYFNFRDPTGIEIGWCGSYASGQDPSKIHPEVYVDLDESDGRG